MKQIRRKRAGERLVEKFQAYVLNHAHGLFSSLGRLSRKPITSAMTVLVLAVTIALAGCFYIGVANLQQITGALQTSHQMSLFLRQDVSDVVGKKLAEQLIKDTRIGAANFISKERAMEEFKANSEFGEALTIISSNPLPHLVQINPNVSIEDIKEINELLVDMQKLPEVEFAQIDMQWVERLQAIIKIAGRGVSLVAILLGFAVTFITGNTIRLELHNRREEIYIAKLVGATHAFIQRPFLYTGFWLGFIAGFSAWLIVTIILLILESPVEQLSSLYNSSFQLLYLGFSEFVLLLMLSSVLAIFGAWVVLNYQLKQINPE